MTTLGDAKMPSLKDKIAAQEAEKRESPVKRVIIKVAKKLGKKK